MFFLREYVLHKKVPRGLALRVYAAPLPSSFSLYLDRQFKSERRRRPRENVEGEREKKTRKMKSRVDACECMCASVAAAAATLRRIDAARFAKLCAAARRRRRWRRRSTLSLAPRAWKDLKDERGSRLFALL